MIIRSGGVRALPAVALVLTFGAGCRRGPITDGETPTSGYKPVDGRTLTVPLQYQPTQQPSGSYGVVRGEVFVQAVDDRTEKGAIGQNTEKAAAVPVVAADDPAAFVKSVVVRQLQSLGATVREQRAESTAQLVLHLTTFWVNETNRYRAEVRVRAEVLDPSGERRWEGVVVGTASNFGRSLSVVNYQETFSNATLQAADRLLSDPACTVALAKRDP
ncbi:MAG TPA: YajG family lipoprotein [Polyangiaceae bacterium]|nr:YajG family lipoprotein [Polyangiaceae bacterium]